MTSLSSAGGTPVRTPVEGGVRHEHRIRREGSRRASCRVRCLRLRRARRLRRTRREGRGCGDRPRARRGVLRRFRVRRMPGRPRAEFRSLVPPGRQGSPEDGVGEAARTFPARALRTGCPWGVIPSTRSEGQWTKPAIRLRRGCKISSATIRRSSDGSSPAVTGGVLAAWGACASPLRAPVFDHMLTRTRAIASP